MRDTIDMAREAGWDDHHAGFDTRIDRLVALVRADERALAAPAQEPTCKQSLQVWVISNGKGAGQFSWDPQDERFWTRMESAAPPAQPAVQEPVAITEQMAFAFHNAITDGAIGTDDLMDIMRGLEAAFAPITTPPAAQRQWVGLTDEEIDKTRFAIQTKAITQRDHELSRAIEAKLKEKNTP